MGQPKKDYGSKTKQEFDQMAMRELAESIFEALQREKQKENEPFESYTHELRLRLHVDVKTFQDRFLKGYDALIETLHSMS